MLQNAMPGEALVLDGVPAGNLKSASQNALPNSNLQEMADKLEKSEAGRKKLRQAIGMLKEKVEANEKVLEINEILRQECEKERVRAEAERNRAEEEKILRERVEKDSHSAKELLVRALQRLDDVERNCKWDQNENERMRKEMKQIVSGLGGAVKAIEAAHSSFEGLEKSLLGKVSNALCASTKSSLLAETALGDAKRAQGTALAAEKLSQSLVSRVAGLEKQGASLDQRVTLLQQEIRMRKLEPLENEQKTNEKRAPNGTSLVAGKPSSKGMVLSKNQLQAKKDCSPEGAGLSADVARAEGGSSAVNTVVAADTHAVDIGGSLSRQTRHGAEATGIPDVETLPESHAKDKLGGFPSAQCRVKADDSYHGMAAVDKRTPDSSTGNTVREALDAARNKRNLSRTTSTSKLILQPQKSSQCQGITVGTLTSNATHASKDCQVDGEEFRGRVQVLSGNGSMTPLAKIERNDQIPANVCVARQTEDNHGRSAGDCRGRRPCIKNKPSRLPDENGAETKLITGNALLTEKENGHNVGNRPVALLKELTKLFLKEKKSHAKVERKLDALRKVLQNSVNDGISNQSLVDGTQEKSKKKKTKGKGNLEDNSKKTAYVQPVDEVPSISSGDNNGVASLSKQVEGKIARGPVEGRGRKRKNKLFVTEDECAVPLRPPAKKVRYSGPNGFDKDVSEAGFVQNSKEMDGPQFPDDRMEVPITPPYPAFHSLTTAAPEVMALTEGMDVDAENDSGGGLNGGWDTDSETSEYDFGKDWLTEDFVLLSPTLPIVPPPSVLGEEADSNASLSWSKNLDDFSLFLDALPPIELGACDVDRTPATLLNIEDSKLRVGDSQDILSGVISLTEDARKELQRALSTETLSDVHCNRERSTNDIFLQNSERGSKPSENSDDRERDGNKEILVGGPLTSSSSLSSGSPPEPSGCLPQDVSTVSSGKSGVVERLAVDSESSKEDVLEDSHGVVKGEELDPVRIESVSHSLELVLGGSVYERDGSSTGSTMRQGPAISTVYTADKIMVASGRAKNVLLGALIHTTDRDSGSYPAVATKIASLLASTNLVKMDLMCIFTAIVVDSHVLWDTEKSSSSSSSKCKPLQPLIDIVRQVLATEVFQNSLPQDQTALLFAVQLQKFLIEGTIKPLSQAAPEKALADGHGTDNSFHFTAPSCKLKRLKALISGGKLFAVWCETIGKLNFLRHSIYSILRFCDMDSHCLLATVSSFANVGCKSLFSVDKDDVVGQAVQVVVSELIHDVEMERQTEGSSPKKEEVEDRQMKMQPCPVEGSEQSTTELLPNLKALRDVIGEEDGRSFEAFLPRLVELFHGVITATLGSHLKDNQHLFQMCLRTLARNEMNPNTLIAANFPDRTERSLNLVHTTDATCSGVNGSGTGTHTGEKDIDRSPVENYCWRFGTVERPTPSMSQSERDIDLVEEWEQKFYDITNAVELVASHLGWEWTYNDFILEHLWKLVSPGAPAITVACVAHMFGLLGRLGREVDSTELPGVDELRKSLLVVLSSDQTSSALNKEGCAPNFPFRAQVAAAQALLVLSSFNRKDEITPCQDPGKIFSKSSELHAKSVKSLWNWVKALKPEIQLVLPPTVRRALLSIDTSNFVPIF